MGYELSDAGNAHLLADCYKNRIKYDHRLKRWLIWRKHWWQADEDGGMTRVALKSLQARRSAAENITASDRRSEEIRHTLKSEAGGRIREMVGLAKDLDGVRDSQSWDDTPYWLGVTNGVVDLRTGELTAGSPDQRVTRHCELAYDPDAEAPLWAATVAAILPADVTDYFQMAVGYSATGETKEQCLFCMFGEGSNGKSTLLDAIARVLGPYAYTMPFTTLEFANRSSISNDVANLVGRRFVVASETQENIRLNEGRIKSLTGDAKVTARFMYKDYFTFRPIGKYWLAFNHKPRTVDDTHGFWRRIRLLTLPNQFTEDHCDPDLPFKLAAESAGILSWIVKGACDWYKHRLTTPVSVLLDTANYRTENDALREYCEDRLDLSIGSKTAYITNRELWADYQAWAKKNGDRWPLGRKGFSQRLERKGLVAGKLDRETRIWYGASFKPDYSDLQVHDDPRDT